MVEHPKSKSTQPKFATRWVTLYIRGDQHPQCFGGTRTAGKLLTRETSYYIICDICVWLCDLCVWYIILRISHQIQQRQVVEIALAGKEYGVVKGEVHPQELPPVI